MPADFSNHSQTLRGGRALGSAAMRFAMAGLSSDAGEARPSRPCSAIRKARARSGEKGLSRIARVRTAQGDAFLAACKTQRLARRHCHAKNACLNAGSALMVVLQFKPPIYSEGVETSRVLTGKRGSCNS